MKDCMVFLAGAAKGVLLALAFVAALAVFGAPAYVLDEIVHSSHAVLVIAQTAWTAFLMGGLIAVGRRRGW